MRTNVTVAILLLCPMLAIHARATGTITIEQAIQEALKNNLDLTAERLNIPVAEARQIGARLRPNPVLSVAGQTLDLLGAGFNPNNPAGPNQYTVHTDFVLERPAKRLGRIAVADAGRRISVLNAKEVERQIILETASACVDLQVAQENLALAEDNLRSLRGIVNVNETKVRAGELARVELERSQVAAVQYEAAVEQAKLQVGQARSRLLLAIGRSANATDITLAGPMRRDDLGEAVQTLRAKALTQRPDLQSLDQAQARSRADLTLQLAQRKVDVVVGAEYTYQRAFGMAGSSLGFSLATPLPFFNRNQGEIARARHEVRLLEARLEAQKAQVETEASIAFMQYETARHLLGNIESNLLAKARSVRETTEYSYKRGEASLIEFLDAQRAFNDAMQSYNEARAAYARSLYLIDAVSGESVISAGGTPR